MNLIAQRGKRCAALLFNVSGCAVQAGLPEQGSLSVSYMTKCSITAKHNRLASVALRP